MTDGAKHGDSIAVNGVCLTVVEHEGDEFTADVMAETLDRSSLGALGVGSRVNLERPTAVGDRLGGHIVQGHVDGTGEILARTPSENWEIVKVSLPAGLARYVVEKAPSPSTASASPSSRPRRALHRQPHPHHPRPDHARLKQPGDPVNLEVDIVAKYVERLLATTGGAQR